MDPLKEKEELEKGIDHSQENQYWESSQKSSNVKNTKAESIPTQIN